MQKVFTGRNSMEAHFVSQVLEAQGICASVFGESLQSVRGELPFTEDTMPSVWVMAKNLGRANQVVDELRQKDLKVVEEKTDLPVWICSNCGERIEGQFTACWKCLTSR